MHSRTQMDKKLGLAKIPAGVFREITRYVWLLFLSLLFKLIYFI
jgi:hypothetical protein